MQRFVSTIVLALFLVPVALGQSFYSEQAIKPLGFGGAIAMYEGDIYIGAAPVTWPAGEDPSGEVIRFSKSDSGEWVEVGRISADDGEHGDEFGRSINITDGQMVVGAPGAEAIYVFNLKDGSWSQTAKVSPHTALPEGREFAGSYNRGGLRNQNIAVVENNVMVSSYDQTSHEGGVHMIHQMGMMWMDMGELEEVGAWSLAANGGRLLIGMAEADSARGGVIAYDYPDGRNWVKMGDMTVEGLPSGARLGRSIAVWDDWAYVGASGYEQFGAVMGFKASDEGTWRHAFTWQQEEDGRRPGFGSGLATDGSSLLVGASGAAYIYDIYGSESEPVRLESSEDRNRLGFGSGLAIEDGVAVIGSPSGDYGFGLATVFERDEEGSWNQNGYLMGDVDRMESVTGTDKIECEDGMVNDLWPCDEVDLVSFLSVSEMAHDRGAQLNDIWGWEDPETGKEYVLQGRTDGLSVVDISNPSIPVVVGNMMRTDGSPGAWWRDVKVYKDHAYVVADGSRQHGMQILDLTTLRDIDPADMPIELEPSGHYTGVASSHNIIINEDTGFAYAVGNDSGGESCGGQLHMISLEDPKNPQFLGCYTHPEFGGTHDAQCVVYHGADPDYNGKEVCLNSNGSAFIVADVSDKSNPTTVSVAYYPNTNYTHQGWLSEDHNYFFMNDELDEMNDVVDHTRTLIWDMSDLDEPILVNEFYLDSSASDHNLYVKGKYMYQSNYQAGLRILDISDPENPVEVGHFDTAPAAPDVKGFAGSWSNYPYFKSGIIAVSSQGEGLYLVRKREVDL